jgi:DNA-binding PadR family transcriptional regulator
MTRHISLGAFEYAALLVTHALGDTAYPVTIREEIERRARRPVSRGALYTTLARLEAKGFLASRMGDPTPIRGGKRKRFYRLTAAGLAAVRAAHSQLVQPWHTAGRLLGKVP